MARKDVKKTITYNNKYNAENYDRLSLMLPKGKREIIKAAATQENISTNEFIRQAIDKYLESLALDIESQSTD